MSSATVADTDQKIRLSKAYGAHAVDMEAAAVAQGAEARGIDFGALKAISDAADFCLPAMDRFVAGDGNFDSVRFACHVALRPWLWGTTIVLARNSSKASLALCDALASYLRRPGVGRQTSHDESLVAALNPTSAASESPSGHTCAGIEAHTEGKR